MRCHIIVKLKFISVKKFNVYYVLKCLKMLQVKDIQVHIILIFKVHDIKNLYSQKPDNF